MVGNPASTEPSTQESPALPSSPATARSIAFSQQLLVNPLGACLSTGGRRMRTKRGFHGLPLLSAVFCSMLSSQEKATCLPSPWDWCWKGV